MTDWETTRPDDALAHMSENVGSVLWWEAVTDQLRADRDRLAAELKVHQDALEVTQGEKDDLAARLAQAEELLRAVLWAHQDDDDALYKARAFLGENTE